MSTRTHQQELNFLREMNRLSRIHIEAFAYYAGVAINRGRLFRRAQRIGMDALEVATQLGRDLRHLNRVTDLAEAYDRTSLDELTQSAFLAVSCRGLRMETVNDCLEDDDMLLRTLGPTGRFARAVVEWRRLAATGEPPPAASVASQIGHFFGVDVDEHSVTDIVRDLVDAFPTDSVGTEQLLAIVAQHRGAVMTSELASVIAADAVKLKGISGDDR